MKAWFMFKNAFDSGNYEEAKNTFKKTLIKNTGAEEVMLGKGKVFAFEIPLMAYILLRNAGIDVKDYECVLRKLYEIHQNLLPEERIKYYNKKLMVGIHLYPLDKMKLKENEKGELIVII